jgi:hypothetical protein
MGAAQLTPHDVYELVAGAGITDPGAQAVAMMIAYAESRYYPDAVHVNSDKYKSTDYGLWQINTHWHPEYDGAWLLDPANNARAMAEISKKGTDWSAWATYKSGKYKEFADQAAGMGDWKTLPWDKPVVAVEDKVKDLLGDWFGKGIGLVLAGIFTAGGLAIVAIGLSRMTGIKPAPTVAGLSTAATAAQLVA